MLYRVILCLTLLSLILPYTLSARAEAVFYTTMGNFTVELYDDIVPITAGNFIDLAEAGFYDGVIFHRIIDDFVIQGGDPTGTGFGGSGVVIPDEFDSSLSNLQYTLSMANSGPNTGTSQFFINLVDNTYLDFDKPPFTSKHPVFGKVISGFDVVQAIGSVPVDDEDRPITPVVMDSVRIVASSSVEGQRSLRHDITMSVYPDPVSSESVLLVEMEDEKRVNIETYELSGKSIGSIAADLHRGRNVIELTQIASEPLAEGIYYIRISYDGVHAQVNFVVIK